MSAVVIAIVGTKGGTGASTVCVDVMNALMKTCNVALVDGDLSASRSIAVLTDSVRAIDAVRTSQIALLRKGRATIVEIAATIESAFTIQPPDVEAVAADVTAINDVVVVDAAQPYAAAVRPFITRASLFVLLVEPTVLGISNARLAQIEMERFGIARSHQVLAIGGRSSAREVSRGEIERALGIRAIAEFGPNTDRRYEKTIEGFAAALRQTPVTASPLAVQPSMSTPIGDRRASRRRAVAEPSVAPERAPLHAAPAADTARRDQRDILKSEINDLLTKRLDFADPARAVDDAGKLAELRAQVGTVVSEILVAHPGVGTAEDVADLRQEIIDEALGLGPLEDLLRDPTVTEIMVNGAERIFVERLGKIEKTAKRFTSERQLRLIIERIIAPIGRRIDESQPMVDARLADGSRVNAIIAPLALDGATLTIRRFPARRMNANDLIKIDALTPEIVDFLRAAVEARLNIMVAGGTGSGKTTFLNVLSSFLPASERIVTIEDAAELSLAQTHVVRLESRPRNIQGAGEVTIRELVRNSLRMRPDRIIVGECRGGEALDMLQAMNTGHDGSLTTIHANSARDAISRVETMVMMAGFDLPIRAIREQISSAIDIVVQLSRMRDGSRKLVSVSEVVGLEGDVVTMQDLARYEQRGLDKEGRVVGEFVFTGVQPMCLRKFEEYGVTFDVRTLSNMTMRAVSW